MDDVLRPLYYEKYFGPKSKFAQYVRNEHPSITVKSINEWLKKQESEQIHYAARKPTHYSSVLAYRPNEDWEMDLMEAGSDLSHAGAHYVLVVIDVFSRRLVSLKALGTKSPASIATALSDAIQKYGKPININCDDGKEFKGAVKTLGTREGIRFIYSQPDDANKNPIAERFNRTLRLQLVKGIERTGNHRWESFLPLIQEHYNSSTHTTLRAVPNDVADGNAISKQQPIKYVTHNFKVGDKVRIRRYKSSKQSFEKETQYHFSTVVHTIRAATDREKGGEKSIADPNKIYVEGIQRYYKPYELMSVIGEPQRGSSSTTIPRKRPYRIQGFEPGEVAEMKESAAQPKTTRVRRAPGYYNEEGLEEERRVQAKKPSRFTQKQWQEFIKPKVTVEDTTIKIKNPAHYYNIKKKQSK